MLNAEEMGQDKDLRAKSLWPYDLGQSISEMVSTYWEWSEEGELWITDRVLGSHDLSMQGVNEGYSVLYNASQWKGCCGTNGRWF